MTTETTFEAIRPQLIKDQITWHEWKEQWEKARDVHAFLGLLHSTFLCKTANEDENQDQFVFLFRVADSYQLSPKWVKCESELKKVADKAFDLLYKNFLSRAECLRYFVRQARLRAAILWYLRSADPRYQGRLYNGHRFCGREIDWFLKNFLKELWESSTASEEWKRDSSMSPSVRFQVLEIASNCGMLRHIMGSSWRGLDTDVLTKLKELALLPLHPIRDEATASFKSVEEALLAGSHAAEAYILGVAAQKEIARQRLVNERKQELDEIDRRRAKIVAEIQ